MEPTNAEIMAKLDLILGSLGDLAQKQPVNKIAAMTPEEFTEHLIKSRKYCEEMKKKRRKARSIALAASKPKTRRKLPRRKTL
jgi:hypothetical protein